MDQLDLFSQPSPLARTHDPISSHKANLAIAKDGTLARHICDGVLHIHTISPLDGVTDDDLLGYIETRTAKRQQRNVIARARGLLEREGYFTRVPGDRVSVIPTQRLIDLYQGES